MKSKTFDHLTCIQIVKYWSHRVNFSIYPAFKAFWTSHQLLIKVDVYRSNSRMQFKYSGWLKFLLILCISAVQGLILILGPSCKGWWNKQYYNSLTSKALCSIVHLSNQFKISNWVPAFILNLKCWYLRKTITFLKCPLIPTFLLLIKARRCNLLGIFCAIFSSFLSAFNNSNIWKENRRSHVKMDELFIKKVK